MVKARQVYARWRKPSTFDRNLVVIGAGSAGLVAAYIAAAVKAKVTLVEKHKMGGDCLNFGCVPSKALIRSAKFLSHVKRAGEWGIRSASVDFAFKDVMDRATALEMAYNVNDGVEIRWGAPEGSQEASTCKRHASSAQRAKMSQYRAWFYERCRPPRSARRR